MALDDKGPPVAKVKAKKATPKENLEEVKPKTPHESGT